MNLYNVALYYISIVVGLIVFILTVYRLVTGKYAKEVRGPVTEQQKRKTKKLQFGFNLFVAVLSGAAVGVVGPEALLDLPYVVRNEYPCTVGIVTEVDKGSQGDISIIIEDETSKEEIEIIFIYKKVRRY